MTRTRNHLAASGRRALLLVATTMAFTACTSTPAATEWSRIYGLKPGGTDEDLRRDGVGCLSTMDRILHTGHIGYLFGGSKEQPGDLPHSACMQAKGYTLKADAPQQPPR